jgi:hypothetical protein
MPKTNWRKYYHHQPPDTVTPFIPVGGTVFGPHDGQIRRSLVLAIAATETEKDNDKDGNQRLAQALAARLNADDTLITQVNQPVDSIVVERIRNHALAVIDECGGSFRFNPMMFNGVTDCLNIKS